METLKSDYNKLIIKLAMEIINVEIKVKRSSNTFFSFDNKPQTITLAKIDKPLATFFHDTFGKSTEYIIVKEFSQLEKLFELLGSERTISIDFIYANSDEEKKDLLTLLNEIQKIINVHNAEGTKEGEVMDIDDPFSHNKEMKRILLYSAIFNRTIMGNPLVKYLIIKEAKRMDIDIESFFPTTYPFTFYNFPMGSKRSPTSTSAAMMMAMNRGIDPLVAMILAD